MFVEPLGAPVAVAAVTAVVFITISRFAHVTVAIDDVRQDTVKHPVCRKYLCRNLSEIIVLHIAQIPLRRLPCAGNFRGSRRNGIWAYAET